jgi:hypothetical protein
MIQIPLYCYSSSLSRRTGRDDRQKRAKDSLPPCRRPTRTSRAARRGREEHWGADDPQRPGPGEAPGTSRRRKAPSFSEEAEVHEMTVVNIYLPLNIWPKFSLSRVHKRTKREKKKLPIHFEISFSASGSKHHSLNELPRRPLINPHPINTDFIQVLPRTTPAWHT